MEKFTLHILGCGSALPTVKHNPSSHVINLRDKLFMIDCGEGTQLQYRRAKLSFSRLNHIFLSHLHGDHIFGLPGFISTLSLLGRTAPLHIYGHKPLAGILQPQLDFCCRGIGYEVVFHVLPEEPGATVYEDRSVKISTVPLRHRVPSVGFIFKEKPLLPHIRRDMIDFLKIPHYAINGIKEGAGWTTDEGDFYPHERLVRPAAAPRAFAYCSDTLPLLENVPMLRGVDLLYHEGTFADDAVARAAETGHSTARQAAEVAAAAGVKRLVIGHFSARYDDESILLKQAREVFADTVLAKEGLSVEV